MPDLKLAQLPDRMPVKVAVALPPELHRALKDYAAVYREAYGAAESVATLIPFMLAAFIDADAGFKKARRSLAAGFGAGTGSRRPGARQPGREGHGAPVGGGSLTDPD